MKKEIVKIMKSHEAGNWIEDTYGRFLKAKYYDSVAEKIVKLFTIPVVSHSTFKNKDVSYKKDKAWQDPHCQIYETATGKVLKDYGVTVHNT